MVSRPQEALYGWSMADERDAQLAYDLARMSDDELRQQFDPSIQPVPILRTLAVTELEKRRQKQANVLLRPKFRLGRVAMLGAIVAAIAVWFWWEPGRPLPQRLPGVAIGGGEAVMHEFIGKQT